MTLEDLRTIVGMMQNDCPDGTIELVHVRNSKWNSKRLDWSFDGTVPRGVTAAVVWHRQGHDSKVVGRFKTLNSGHYPDVELETIQAGIVGKYLTIIKWTATCAGDGVSIDGRD